MSDQYLAAAPLLAHPSQRGQRVPALSLLAILVVRQFITCELVVTPPNRVAFSAIRRIIQLGTDTRLAQTVFEFGLDILSAVPAERISSTAFQSEAWPRAHDAVERLREKHRALTQRREGLQRRKKHETD